jgi:hypothetical protein
MLRLILFLTTVSIFSINHPIDIFLKKDSKDSYKIEIFAKSGFAIQKEAPNKVKFSSKDKINFSTSELKLSGKTYLDKPEYLEKVDPLKIKITGKGKVEITSKIFYCDLNKSICYPATIKQEELIQ